MNRVTQFVEATAERIAQRTRQLGQVVRLDAGVLDRSDSVSLAPPGRQSANSSCRLIRAGDSWIAANLARSEDVHAVPALLEVDGGNDDAWNLLETHAPSLSSLDLVARGQMLGIALAKVGETPPPATPCRVTCRGARTQSPAALRIIDFSSLWAGPLCGSVFANIGR